MTADGGGRGLAALSGEETSRLLGLTVPESSQRSAVTALGIDPLDAQIRQVVFSDTLDPTLHDLGVVVRARRSQGGANGSVVKLRPVAPTELPGDLRRSPAFVVEVDAMPGGCTCSGSSKAELGPTHVRKAMAGERPLRKLAATGPGSPGDR
jgi:hypothetical protein